MKNIVYRSCVIVLVIVALSLYLAKEPETPPKTKVPLALTAPEFINAAFVIQLKNVEPEIEIREEVFADEESLTVFIQAPPVAAITYTTVNVPLKEASRILAPIPEPETCTMLLAGLGVLVGISKWKSSRNPP